MSLVQSNRFHGAPKDTATRLRITLTVPGRVLASGTAGDIRLSVSRAAVRARKMVRRISSQTESYRAADTSRPAPTTERLGARDHSSAIHRPEAAAKPE